MKSVFRATTPDDEVRLRAFLALAYSVPGDSPFVNAALMHWKYWAPRDDYDGPRSYVLERGGEIVAHSGVWPMPLKTPEGCARGFHMMDWASHPGAPGSGLALVQRLTQIFDFLVAIGGTEMTRKVLPALGCRVVAETWVAARPLKPLEQALSHQHANWKLPARFLRNAWWSRIPPVSAPKGWTAKEIDASDAAAAPAGTPVDSQRGSAFFRYLASCPVAGFRFFHLVHEGRRQGRFALSLVGKQARIAGVWLDSPVPEALDAAYVLAQQEARRIGSVCEISARGSTPASRAAAIKSGFRMVDAMPVYLLRKRGTMPEPPFEFQMADNDAVFLHGGSSEFLT